jgi:hypothetical protein
MDITSITNHNDHQNHAINSQKTVVSISNKSASPNKNELKEMHTKIIDTLNDIKNTYNSNLSVNSIFSISQKSSCIKKIRDELNQPYSYSEIDPLYIAKHEMVKTKLIDAIYERFNNMVSISSEQKMLSGKMDIRIVLNRIILSKNNKTITIEIKSGKSIDLFQIERYSLESDIILIVRIPSSDVFSYSVKSIENELLTNMDHFHRKLLLVKEGKVHPIPGDWCKGCHTACEFRKPRYEPKNCFAKLDDMDTFFKNTYEIVDKTIQILERIILEDA